MGLPRRVRLVPPLDEWPWAVRAARSVAGRVVMVAAFAAGLWLHGAGWWREAAVILAWTSLWPARRRAVLLVGTLVFLGRFAWFPWSAARAVARAEGVAGRIEWTLVEPAASAAALALAVGYHALARARPTLGPLRRPIVTWLVGYLALLAFASYGPVTGVARVWLWAVVAVLGRYVWFVPFSLLDRHTTEPRAALLHVGHWLPFWSSASASTTPFGKGSAYLRRIEAKDAEGLATCQLKGLKLLWWAGVLVVLEQLVEWFLHGNPRSVPRALGLSQHLGLPNYGEVFDAWLRGSPFPVHVTWGALAARFVSTLLSMAIFGHVIVATLRMAGFRALRNTYRPLESTSIAEFWNRYYYYFKELLVDVFFYPTFLRYWKRHPRARTFVATLAAAGGGNVLYHFLAETELVARHGLLGALWEFRVYFLYGLLLGTAIGLSQQRRRARRAPEGWLARRVLAPFWVLLFYCVLGVFDVPLRSTSIADHTGFLLTLVGLR